MNVSTLETMGPSGLASPKGSPTKQVVHPRTLTSNSSPEFRYKFVLKYFAFLPSKLSSTEEQTVGIEEHNTELLLLDTQVPTQNGLTGPS